MNSIIEIPDCVTYELVDEVIDGELCNFIQFYVDGQPAADLELVDTEDSLDQALNMFVTIFMHGYMKGIGINGAVSTAVN